MRNLHFWFAVGMGLAITGLAASVLRIALTESLWLDELHTSWAVSGSWQEIASRAAAGNQTPLYFWLIGLVSQTLGQQSEWLLRIPSVTAWVLAIGLVAWQIRSIGLNQAPHGYLFVLCVVAWIVIDRNQWFYATEARPYALVQLVSLAGWCCIHALAVAEVRPNRTRTLIAVWCLLAVVNVYLHLTAILPVFIQWLAGAWLFWRKPYQHPTLEQPIAPATPRKQKPNRVVWTAAAVTVGLALLPILQIAFPVWQRRTQWAAFASDVSLSKALAMFPFVPVLLCVLVGCAIDRLGRSDANTKINPDIRWLWWLAMLGPWLLAWILSAAGVAPMFHMRYIFASALPLFIVGAIELQRCRHRATRWLTGLAVAVAIVFSQGSSTVWRAGYLVGTLRGEDWRAASKWIGERIEPSEPLLCSSGLIEANSSVSTPMSLPLEAGFAEYLSFPLRGIYRVEVEARQIVPVTPLVGDHRQWAVQVIERLSQKPASLERMWLVYRGAPGRLKIKLAEFLADLRLKHLPFEASKPKRFGNLYVVELKR